MPPSRLARRGAMRTCLARCFAVCLGSMLWAGSGRAQSSDAPSAGIPPTPPSPSIPSPPPPPATHAVADSIAAAPAPPLPTPVLMAGFALPSTQMDLAALHLLRACQAQFERAVLLSARGTMAHGPGRGTPSSATPEAAYVLLSDSAITVGRQCLARIGDTKVLPPVSLPFLLRYAVGINDDTLAQQVLARQLAIAGTDIRDRSRVLDTAIRVLLHNQWDQQSEMHRTPAHDSLAFRYAAQLDTMQPLAQVLASRLRVREAVREVTKPAVWNVDEDLAWSHAGDRLAKSVPLRAVPVGDSAEIWDGYGGSHQRIAWLNYLKAPTHANLTAYLVVHDSLFGVPRFRLVNHPAPRIEADYWFNVPAGMSTPPVMPVPKTVTLLMFADSLSNADAAQLQQLHTHYPALQIVLMSMTVSGGADPQTPDQLAQQAARIAARFTEALHWPVMTGVLDTKYHTETDQTDIPIASPMLDGFHLDPRKYAGKLYLMDADGWIIEDRALAIWSGQLIQRLLAP